MQHLPQIRRGCRVNNRLLPFYVAGLHKPQRGHGVDEARGRLLGRNRVTKGHTLIHGHAAVTGIHLTAEHTHSLPK